MNVANVTLATEIRVRRRIEGGKVSRLVIPATAVGRRLEKLVDDRELASLRRRDAEALVILEGLLDCRGHIRLVVGLDVCDLLPTEAPRESKFKDAYPETPSKSDPGHGVVRSSSTKAARSAAATRRDRPTVNDRN
jgi:hypothetical protein